MARCDSSTTCRRPTQIQIRALFRALSGAAIVAAGLFVMMALYLLATPQDQLRRVEPRPAYEASRLNERVGEYRLDDGRRVIVTYSAPGGLAIYGLHGARFTRADYLSSSVIPQPDGSFEWQPFEDGAARDLRFLETDEGTSGFEWRDGGERRTAERVAASYSQLQMSWDNDRVPLSGTAFVPTGEIQSGAVIIHGSGNSDRDNLWYLHIVLELARKGVAVLFPDKRGCGRSGGDWRVSSMEELALDTVSGRAALAGETRIPDSAIGLVGISQGGKIAPLAASLGSEPAFLINISGSAVGLEEALAHETVQNLRSMGVPRFLNFAMHPYAMAIAKRRRPVFWEKNAGYDPLPHWASTEAPALVIYGSEDEFDNVPVKESVDRLESLARHRPQLEVRVFEGAGHGLMDAETRELLPDFLSAISGWALEHGTEWRTEWGQVSLRQGKPWEGGSMM